jgi:hypothetical protein
MQGWGAVSLILAASQLQDLTEYLSSVEGFVVQEQAKFIKRVEAAIAAHSLQGEDKDEYYSHHEDEFDQLHSTFPRIVYSSTLLTACSLFESSLVDLCKDFEKDAALPTPKGWHLFDRDKGVRKAAAFLRDNFGIELNKYPHWASILDLYRIRDCIAHANGDVSIMNSKQAQELRDAVVRHAALGISITAYHRLDLGSVFVAAAIDRLAGLWQELLPSCHNNAVLGPHYWR